MPSRDLPCVFAGQAERLGHRAAEERIPERCQNQPHGAFVDGAITMALAELIHHRVNRLEDRVQGIAVAGQDHPCGERAGTLFVERVKGAIDNDPGIRFARAGLPNRLRDPFGDSLRDEAGKFGLKPGRRSEMMKEVCVGLADPRAHRLQRHRLRTGLDQKRARRLQRCRSTLRRAETFTSY